MKNTKKTRKNKDEYNFDVFKNYKCDGQYVMQFKDDKITIKEEITVNDNNSLSK